MQSRPIWVLASVAGLIILSGCNTQRPLPTVREQGDRAFRSGDFAKARAEYQEYRDRKPGEPEVERLLAESLLQLNRPHEALSHAQQAYDLRPGEDAYTETFAAAMFAAEKTDQLHRFLRNQAQDRGRPADHIRLGRYAAKMGDADGAEHALITAATLDRGQSIEPQLALADFYRSIGDQTHEKERLRMALYLDAKNAQVQERLRQMGEIPGPSIAIPPAEAR